MFVDIRWLVLALACIIVLTLIRKRKEWAEPILVMVAVATLLVTLLFFVASPLTGS